MQAYILSVIKWFSSLIFLLALCTVVGLIMLVPTEVALMPDFDVFLLIQMVNR